MDGPSDKQLARQLNEQDRLESATTVFPEGKGPTIQTRTINMMVTPRLLLSAGFSHGGGALRMAT